jgi:hypothetical protein
MSRVNIVTFSAVALLAGATLSTNAYAHAPARAKPTQSAPHATMRPNPEDTPGYQSYLAAGNGTCSPVVSGHFGPERQRSGVLPYCGGGVPDVGSP